MNYLEGILILIFDPREKKDNDNYKNSEGQGQIFELVDMTVYNERILQIKGIINTVKRYSF